MSKQYVNYSCFKTGVSNSNQCYGCILNKNELTGRRRRYKVHISGINKGILMMTHAAYAHHAVRMFDTPVLKCSKSRLFEWMMFSKRVLANSRFTEYNVYTFQIPYNSFLSASPNSRNNYTFGALGKFNYIMAAFVMATQINLTFR